VRPQRAAALVLLGALGAWGGIEAWQSLKPLPPGLHVASPPYCGSDAQAAFIADVTAADAFGRAAVSQGILDAMLEVVQGAHRFIVLDYALFGADATATAPQRHGAAALTDALLERRRNDPQLQVLLITDPVNERYGATRLAELELLRAAGAEVVLADTGQLRDSNPLYSGLWRLTLAWWDRYAGPMAFAGRRLNFKADGRRVIIADDGRGGLAAVIGSATPLDSESGWSNVAVRLGGEELQALLASELAVAGFSGGRGRAQAFAPASAAAPAAAAQVAAAQVADASCGGAGAGPPGSGMRVQLLTEGAIREALLARLDATQRGDSIEVAVFHLAERSIVDSLLSAARRGASVRLILDPGTAGVEVGAAGIPNRPVAAELVARSGGAVRVRWYRTHGERFHDGLVMIESGASLWLALGSAQLTRRSLDDYDLEADVAIELLRDSALGEQALGYFDTLWSNRASLGIEYTTDFAVFADPAQSDYWLGRVMEGTGLSAF